MSSSAATTLSAIAAACSGSGPSPASRSGLIPNGGWPRSRNQTRLAQSGGVSRRHSAAELALGVEHDDRRRPRRAGRRGRAQQRRGLPDPWPPTSRVPYLRSSGWMSAGAVAGAQHRRQHAVGGRRRCERPAAVIVAGRRAGRGAGVRRRLRRHRRRAADGVGVGARMISGGTGMRGTASRRTGTPFMRAEGSASRCATSAAETSERGEGTRRWRAAGSGGGRGRGGRASSGGAGGSRRGAPARRRRASCRRSRGCRRRSRASSQNRLRFWVRCALAISARLSVEVRPPSGRPQRSARTSRFSWRR